MPPEPYEPEPHEPASYDVALAELVRASGRDVLATLARQVGDLALAEDAVQDAVVRALETWPRDGVPPSPVAWLRLVARNRAIDLLRQTRSRTGREERAVTDDPALRPGWTVDIEPSVLHDDLLRLLFTCCHPSLAPASRVALALRTLCGLGEDEVARALLSSPDAVARRLVRARRKIKVARIPYAVPADHELPARWEAVLTTVHLMFNEGYAATDGPDLTRPVLVAEALRLARLLADLQPDDAAARALVALMVLHDSRRATRTDAAGRPVLLPDQDRARWDHDAVREGVTALGEALRLSADPPHRFVAQAGVAACHSLAPTWEETDWAAVVSWYDVLRVVDPSPVVELNRAVAVGEREGPAVALALVDAVRGLDTYPYLHATRGVLLRRLGRDSEAAAADARAVALGLNEPARRLLVLDEP